MSCLVHHIGLHFPNRGFLPKIQAGEMAEWLKAHAWKACLLERVTWVRIPLSPPYFQQLTSDETPLKPSTALPAPAARLSSGPGPIQASRDYRAA